MEVTDVKKPYHYGLDLQRTRLREWELILTNNEDCVLIVNTLSYSFEN